jgi:hypothetical protein
MYIQNEPFGRHAEDPTIGSVGGLSMAVAVPIGVGIAIGEVLEVILIVLSAIAAAYLLIQAYEAAQSRGFGVALATRLLSAGLGRLLSGARRLVDVIRRLIERARRLLNPRPECALAIADMARVLAEIEQTLAELAAESQSPAPRVPELRRLMELLKQRAAAARGPVQNLLQACGPTT